MISNEYDQPAKILFVVVISKQATIGSMNISFKMKKDEEKKMSNDSDDED